MDNYGVFRIANPNPQSAEEYIYYTWKGFNEEYTEIDKTGGVFYSADFYFCQKVKIGDN